MWSRRLCISLALAFAVTACGEDSSTDPTTSNTPTPTSPSTAPGADNPEARPGPAPMSWEVEVVDGNPSCQDQGYDFGFKIEPVVSGTYNLGDAWPGQSVTIVVSGALITSWSSTFGVDAVIVKGGPNANVYTYDPESFGDTDDLSAPINPENNQPYGLSHVEFCYDFNLEVSKTATTTFDRDFDWTIAKTSATTAIELAAGQTFVASYEVTVTKSAAQDANWAVSGTITILNSTPLAATITSVTDVVSPAISADVECGVTFPYVLAAGGTLECTYETDLPDGTARTNTATVATSGAVEGDDGTAAVTFGDPTTVTDNCIDVTDDKYGDLGEACETKTFNYDLTIGPYALCDTYTFTNVASADAGDEGTISDDHTVTVVVVGCGGQGEDGCSLTQGYWKTHSENGPAPYDDTWAMLPSGAATTFYLSGQTWYQVFWTPPKGNPYYILAHQYMAAVLNGLNGSDVSSIQATLDAVETFFETYPPGTSWTKEQKQQITGWAGILGSYNEGTTGPGHCDQEESAQT